MAVFSKPFSIATLSAALSCTGCAGILFDSSRHSDIDRPVPRMADKGFFRERWACTPPDESSARATREDFLRHWGEPKSRQVDGRKETWRYGEDGRWCGIWLIAVVPIPLLMPICDTYDMVEFENGIALRSASRRFHVTGIFATIAPYPGAAILREGAVTEDRPNRPVGSSPEPCAWPIPEGDASR